MTKVPTPPHFHPEYWTERDHERYEDRTSNEIRELRKDVEVLSTRITYLLGGLGLLMFLATLFAPLIRTLLGVPAT